MIDAILSPGVIGLFALIAWVSAFILLRAAFRADPPVGALTERAVIALVIAVFLTLYAIVASNTNFGLGVFTPDGARRIIRAAVIVLGLVPVAWVVLWLTGHLGEGGHG